MTLTKVRRTRNTFHLRTLPTSPVPPLGLQVDAAALSWLKLQSHDRLEMTQGGQRLHPLSFIKLILRQVYCFEEANVRKLLKESFLAKRIPTQNLFDHHFTRSLKYISKDYELELTSRKLPLPGDIVIFSDQSTYVQVHWAICGSGNRLYSVDQQSNRLWCSCLTEEQSVVQILQRE